MTAQQQVDHAHVEHIAREVARLDRLQPGTGREVVAAIVRRLGADVLKPAPRSSEGVDPKALIG